MLAASRAAIPLGPEVLRVLVVQAVSWCPVVSQGRVVLVASRSRAGSRSRGQAA